MSAQNWTTKRPSKPGWYWYRCIYRGGDKDGQIVNPPVLVSVMMNPEFSREQNKIAKCKRLLSYRNDNGLDVRFHDLVRKPEDDHWRPIAWLTDPEFNDEWDKFERDEWAGPLEPPR